MQGLEDRPEKHGGHHNGKETVGDEDAERGHCHEPTARAFRDDEDGKSDGHEVEGPHLPLEGPFQPVQGSE